MALLSQEKGAVSMHYISIMVFTIVIVLIIMYGGALIEFVFINKGLTGLEFSDKVITISIYVMLLVLLLALLFGYYKFI